MILFYFDTAGSVVEHEITAPVFAVKAFERGYHPIHSRANAATLNRERYSPEVLESALEASMFGWHTPAAQKARHYVEQHEKDCCNTAPGGR